MQRPASSSPLAHTPVFLAPPSQPQAGLLLSALHRSTYPQAALSFTGTIFAT
jgi:hypothetical protein